MKKSTRKTKTKKKSSSKKKTKTLSFTQKHKESVLIALLSLLFISVYVFIFDSKIDLNGDNASYHMLAKSLASGEGYINIFTAARSPHGHFPPGYPMLLAPFMMISDHIIWAKCISGLFALISLILCNLVLKKLGVSWLHRLLIGIILICNYNFLKYSTIIMSEMPLIMITMAALYFFLEYHNKKHLKYLAISGLLLVIAIHIKTLAISLVAGFVLHHLYERDWRALGLTLTVVLVGLAPYQIRNYHHGIKSSYVKQLTSVNPYQPKLGQASAADYVTRVQQNFIRYLSKEIPNAIYPIKEVGPSDTAQTIHFILGAIALILMLIGLYSLEKYRLCILAYLGAMLAILLMWPSVWYGLRFMIGILPLIIALAFIGFIFVVRLLPIQDNKTKSYLITIVAALFICAQTGIFSTAGERLTILSLNKVSLSNYSEGHQHFFDMAEWSNKHILPQDVIASRKPTLYYIFDKGHNISYPRAPKDDADFFMRLDELQVKYVVLSSLGYGSATKVLIPMIRKYPDRFELVHSIPKPGTFLFKYLPSNVPQQ